MLVHLALEQVRHLTRRRQVVRVRVHHDRVGVAVDDLEVVVARHFDCMHQRVTAARRDELGERTAVESRAAEAEAPVHRVGHDLEGFLPNVELRLALGVLLGLEQRLDLATARHEHADHARQHARLLRASGQLGERHVAFRIRLGAFDRREADVVLLHDRRVERVEVEEQHELVVEAALRLKDKTTSVRGLLAPRLAKAAPAAVVVVVGLDDIRWRIRRRAILILVRGAFVGDVLGLRFALLELARLVRLFIRLEVLELVKLMQQ